MYHEIYYKLSKSILLLALGGWLEEKKRVNKWGTISK